MDHQLEWTLGGFPCRNHPVAGERRRAPQLHLGFLISIAPALRDTQRSSIDKLCLFRPVAEAVSSDCVTPRAAAATLKFIQGASRDAQLIILQGETSHIALNVWSDDAFFPLLLVYCSHRESF